MVMDDEHSSDAHETCVRLLSKKCESMQWDNERMVYRLHTIKKQARRYSKDIDLLKARLDLYNDNWRTAQPDTLMNLDRTDLQDFLATAAHGQVHQTIDGINENMFSPKAYQSVNNLNYSGSGSGGSGSGGAVGVGVGSSKGLLLPPPFRMPVSNHNRGGVGGGVVGFSGSNYRGSGSNGGNRSQRGSSSNRGGGVNNLSGSLCVRGSTSTRRRIGTANAGLSCSGALILKQSTRSRADKERDPNAPKRPANAFFQFCQEQRSLVMDEMNSDLQPGEPEPTKQELTRQLAFRWRMMSPMDKTIYVNMYEQSKQKYKMEMLAYKQPTNLPATSFTFASETLPNVQFQD